MLKSILLGLVAVLAAFLVIVAVQPSSYRVERSTTIAAPPAAVFAHVNDFHRWDAWSPWAKLDPTMKTTFTGPESGPGAIYAWAGNSDVGEGRMTLTESRPPEHVAIKLEFLAPFESTATTRFTFQPQDDATTVTWTMHGENNFLAKAFGLFMDMDAMIGGDFEKGLAQLKHVVEAQP